MNKNFKFLLAFGVIFFALGLSSCSKDNDEEENQEEEQEEETMAVDLGLPSGTLWAKMNLGASSAEDYGSLYFWGCTKVMTGTEWKAAYPDIKSKYWDKSELEPEDDAAYVNLGSGWRIPSREECYELVEKCTWSLTKVNGVNCYSVKGPNGKTICIPLKVDSNGSFIAELQTRSCGVTYFEDWFQYLYAYDLCIGYYGSSYNSERYCMANPTGHEMGLFTIDALPIRAVKEK